MIVLQVEFHHMGTYKLKGVAGNQTVMQINSMAFADRVFPKKPASSKAEIVSLENLDLSEGPSLVSMTWCLLSDLHI